MHIFCNQSHYKWVECVVVKVLIQVVQVVYIYIFILFGSILFLGVVEMPSRIGCMVCGAEGWPRFFVCADETEGRIDVTSAIS